MTIKEAIEANKNLLTYMKITNKQEPDCQFSQDNISALEMAIKVLEEQETVLEKLIKIRAEIEMLPTTLITVYRPNSTVERDAVELGSVLRVFDKYK